METRKEAAPVLVLGGTGHYGRHIVKSLLRLGQPVRVLSRNAIHARRVVGDPVEIIEGDLTSPEAVRKALDGVQALVVSVSAFTPKLIRKLRQIERDAVLALLESARRAGIFRVVYLSVYDVREEVVEEYGIESARVKLDVETALGESDLNGTILGAAPSMELFFAGIRGDRMMVPGGGVRPLPTISPVDVGEIAAQTVGRNNLGGRRIRMTGPEALSFPDAARRLSAVLGRSISIQRIPLLLLHVASLAMWPFNPFLRHLVSVLKLMNDFPQDVVADVPSDHKWLVDTFDYTPLTLEMEAQRRFGMHNGA